MRRYVTMLALAAAFALPATSASSAAESTTTTTTTTVTEPTGRLVISDAKSRSFRLGSAGKVYVAPPSVDLSELSGKEVRVHLNDDGEVSRVTRTTETIVETD